MIFFCRFFTVVALLFIPAFFVHAATLALDPKTGSFGPGDTFVVTVRLDLAREECVNAGTVEVRYPTEWMKASAVSKGESLFSLWPSEPVVDHERGVVTFSGGIPGGYCGRVQGDPGKTNILGKIVFSIPGNTTGGEVAGGPVPLLISFGQSSVVLLNDGMGTPAPLEVRAGEYVRMQKSAGAPNEWLDIVHGDTIPPDLFSATITQDPKTLQGKYFLVFATVDKQSGVHHYEVQEDDPARFGMVRGVRGEHSLFINATSPYVLRDQELGSRIIVRAIDHAGNVQESLLPPKGDLGTMHAVTPGGKVSALWWYALGALAVLLTASIAILIVRKRQ
jgi:hypothetical protein